MYHRVANADVSELNRVLSLIQQGMQNQELKQKGVSSTINDRPTTTPTNATGKVVIRHAQDTGLLSALPVIVNATISTNYPQFGFGANWGENWGL
jgi:hypothetical protein